MDAQQAPISDGMDAIPSDESDDDIGLSTPRPRHDMSYVPDYTVRSLRSGLKRDGRLGGSSGLERNEGGGGSATPVVDSAEYLSVALSSGLPGGIQLSQVPDPQNVREAMAAPDADGWSDAMGKEMANLNSHDVYELVPRVPGMRTLRLGWVLHRKFKNGVFEKNNARLVDSGMGRSTSSSTWYAAPGKENWVWRLKERSLRVNTGWEDVEQGAELTSGE